MCEVLRRLCYAPLMLIVCHGEDSYRALAKARELEAAFKEKYDPEGRAVEHLASGKDGVEALLMNASGGSLFVARRFFRVDGLLSGCPKGRVEALKKVLAQDVEMTIVVTVEEKLNEKSTKAFFATPKLIQYEFPYFTGQKFILWAAAEAKALGVTDEKKVRAVADIAQGDSWRFVTELAKVRAGGVASDRADATPTVYDVIDRLLVRRADRWSAVRAFDDANAVLATAATQARALLLVKNGQTAGVHPYVARKLQALRTDAAPEQVYGQLARALLSSRSGAVDAEEALDVWG